MAGIPFFISCSIKALMFSAAFLMPASSSGVSGFSPIRSNQECMGADVLEVREPDGGEGISPAVSPSPCKKITTAVSCSAPDTVAALVSRGTDMVLPHIYCRAPRLGPPLPGGFKTSREIFLFFQHRHTVFPCWLTLPGPKLF